MLLCILAPSFHHFCRFVLLLVPWLLIGEKLQAQQLNLALNRPVISSGANFGSFKPSALTDGTVNTYTAPAAASGTLGFYYQVDLGRRYRLDRILLRNRGDGCCPERLSHFRVEVYGDGGDVTGPLNWSAVFRADGSNSGANGIDVITASAQPAGDFAGRYIRVVNNNGAGYSPQLAEIEVYGGLTPEIRLFAATDDTLEVRESTVLRWEIQYATGASIEGLGAIAPVEGSAIVRPGETTFYTLTATNEIGSVTKTIGVGIGEKLVAPVISEFSATGLGGYKDEDGEESDWIELRNPNRFGLDLSGFGLTDDPARPLKWLFPQVKIPAGGYLVVFASGKDRRDPEKRIHTNFRLDAAGDFLALSRTTQDGFLQQFPAEYPRIRKFPAMPGTVGYGMGSNSLMGFLRPATPGSENGRSYEGVVEDTKFSRDRGFSDTNFLVTITTATPGTVIRWTTNRTAPTASTGNVFSGPIPITRTTVLRAAAFREGWAPSDVDTHTYVFPTNVINSAAMRTSVTRNAIYGPKMRESLLQIPSISMVTSAAVRDSADVQTSFEWLDPAGGKGIQEDCGVRLFGGAFTDFAKKSFRLGFSRDYGAARLRYPVFKGFERGLRVVEEFDELELRSGSHDMEMRGFYMSNIFADDTMLAMGQLNPHGRFVHLYLNGEYWGVYHLRERWGAAMHQSYLGGSVTNYESINGNWNVGGWAEPGTAYDGDGSTWARVKSLRRNYAAVRDYLDVPQFIDFMLTWIWGRCEDEYRCVGPTTPGSGFKFYVNDADGFFQSPANPWYGEPSNRAQFGTAGRQPGDGPGNLFSGLFVGADPDYRVLLADRIYRAFFDDGALVPARTILRLEERCREMELPFLAEAARWNYRTPANWTAVRDDILRNWLPTRSAAVLGQLKSAGFYPSLDAPVFAQRGGMVTHGQAVRFVGPAGALIYYTEDGSDPRMAGGAVSPAAKVYRMGGLRELLVGTGSDWKWYSDGVGLGASDLVAGHASWSNTNWKHPLFDDSVWQQGRAQFGYGEGDEITRIPFGPDANNKWITSYFRKGFAVTKAGEINGLKVRLKADDGAIVYLNGIELVRSAVRAGAVSGTTPADASPDDGQGFQEFDLPSRMLQEGANVIAVELHQANGNTSDASFDLELTASRVDSGSQIEAAILRQDTLIKARAFSGTQWSALSEALFDVVEVPNSSPGVVVSEIHFHPEGDGAAEFLEVANLGNGAINLKGASFVEGVNFDFPQDRDVLMAPGQRLVLVRDLFEFQKRFGNRVEVAGVYDGSLDNGGERLTLVIQSNLPPVTVTYGTQPPWPTAADGGGYSLVLAHPSLGLNEAAAWRLAAGANATPGLADGTRFAGNPDADLDGDGLPALVEYAIGTTDLDAGLGRNVLGHGFEEGGRFIVSFQRRLAADDVLLRVEYSVDLIRWVPAMLLRSEVLSAGFVGETWGAGVEPPPNGFYLRLNAVRNP